MAERTTVRLPEDLIRRAKIKAAAEGRTLTSLIEDGLRLVVTDKPAQQKPKIGPIPVSEAKGWLRPGLTLRDVEEMEDLEYAERLMKGFE
ncbi:MAG: hypothetical protein J0H63_10680 [Rhizobiales bacterium]|nr:hypothetical protein [Hyphomicrobiales bacterium]MBN9010568.1 hypothetical protein [Hyphomicrobiales bacterium]